REHLDLYRMVWPGSADARLLAARAARQLGEFDAAEEHLVAYEDLRGEPSDASALEWALLWAQLGDLDRVEEALRARLENNDPQTPHILDALAQGYLRMHRIVDSLACLQRWLDKEPDNHQALFVRGRVWERTFSYARAIKDFARVVEMEPENDEVRLYLANCLVENGQHKEGVKHLEHLRRRRPDDTEVLVRLAFGLHNLTRTDEAREILDGVLAHDPEHVPALIGRGQLALQSESPLKAEGWLRRAVRWSPF